MLEVSIGDKATIKYCPERLDTSILNTLLVAVTETALVNLMLLLYESLPDKDVL